MIIYVYVFIFEFSKRHTNIVQVISINFVWIQRDKIYKFF